MIDETYHQNFRKKVVESDDAVRVFVNALRQKGFWVALPPTKLAKTHADWASCSDPGDLYFAKTLEGLSHGLRAEVTGLTIDFSGREDWPFGRNFIVEEVGVHDRKMQQERVPHAYYKLSADRAYGAAVMVGEAKNWRIDKRPNKDLGGQLVDYYFSPIELVEFFTMPKPEKA